MRRIKEILRLRFEHGLSDRQIAGACHIGKSTVFDYLVRARTAGLTWPQVQSLTDEELETRLFPALPGDTRRKPSPDWGEIYRDRRGGTTLQILWEEYQAKHPDGYGYSHFCDLYQDFARSVDVTMRQTHMAGDKLFVDYAGQTVPIVDTSTGELRLASIFVAVLGASNYTFAEATWSQRLPDWIGSHVRALAFFGGVSKAIVPDNLKSGVTKPWYYDPEINATYAEMARHYRVAILPARICKPRDKAKVEAGVQFVQRWLLAQLRHQRFFSLAALNEAIGKLLRRLNERPFRKLPGSRQTMFESMEKPMLAPLPPEPYEYAEWKRATVNIDYHVEFDRHYYSVPYTLARKVVDVRATARTIEIFHQSQRVASHLRSREVGKHTTLKEHMPPHHQFCEFSPSRFLEWAAKIGPHVHRVVEAILTSRVHPEQGYRACMGVLRFAQQIGRERLEAACIRAITIGAPRYSTVKRILEKGQDRLPLPNSSPSKPLPKNELNRDPKSFGGQADAETTEH